MRKLHNKKDGSLEEYCKQIEKAKKQGTLVKLSTGEVERLKGRPHHYTLNGIVYKPDSISISVMLVNNTSVIAQTRNSNPKVRMSSICQVHQQVRKLFGALLTL